MSQTLILTEKPSVARDFARALKVSGNHDGYIENNMYIITWAVGHLVELKKPEDYDARWKTWSMESLPIMPVAFEYTPIASTQKQFYIVQHLLKKNINKIIIATDAGREGEVIARTILQLCNRLTDNALYRFWTSQALTESVIREALDQCKPATDYDRLWKAGQSRQIADWLVGMNGSRAATLKMNDLFSVGRVQTAVLALLVDRRRERENFKPEDYWVLKALFSNSKGTWWGTWFHKRQTRISTEAIAQEKEKKIAGQDGQVQSVKKQKKSEPPPFLYALTDLQRDANNKFGFSAQQTLQLAQDLYEKFKCLSYPRTDSHVLGSKNVDLVKTTIDTLSNTYAEMFEGVQPKRVSNTYKRVFNDAKLTDHHALMPLTPLPSRASQDHQKIYMLVLKRFAQAFHADCRFEQTEIITIVCDETFRTKGKVILVPGWRILETTDTSPQKRKASEDSEDEEDQAQLPPLEKDDPAHVEETNCLKKQTKPPPEYTEATLLRDMTNPGRYVTEDELKKIYRGDLGLGTQSTRAQTIETLLSRKYIARKKRQVIATDKGCLLIETLRQFNMTQKLTSPEETARWEMQLEDIAQGKGSDLEFLEGIKQFVIQSIDEFKTHTIKIDQSKLGECPKCGGNIIKGRVDYGCANWRQSDGACTVVLRSTVNGRSITPHMIRTLLTEKSIGPYAFSNNTPEYGIIQLKKTDDQWELTVKASSKKPKKASKHALSECPACGGDVIETPKAYGCANWKDSDGGCKFKIWKTIAKREIQPEEARQLIEKGSTDILKGFTSKKGNSFDARLILQTNSGNVPEAGFQFQ
ncbi:MAG: DNA topoisomerase 3 [Candidatus Magnetomorum sp.]|nr:DNA topoisomerase 3 [Candidatus Magnetomorum sp.]